MIEKTISSKLLENMYDSHEAEYDGNYPVVKNPRALLSGISDIIQSVSDNGLAPNDKILLHVIENTNDEFPEKSDYVITIEKYVESVDNAYNGKEKFAGSQFPPSYAVKLFYKPTMKMESISTFEEDKVIWSPDNMSNTQHPHRTKYYMGFAYLICEKSDGFDIEPLPENELTVEDLILLGVDGELLPPEAVEIELPDQDSQEHHHDHDSQEEESSSESESKENNKAIPQEDDTEVLDDPLENYENDDDIDDFDKLFDELEF